MTCKLGRRTKIRAYHGGPCQRVRQGIKRDISDAGEQRIGYFGQNRILHVDEAMNVTL
jgi:hypothetical protein